MWGKRLLLLLCLFLLFAPVFTSEPESLPPSPDFSSLPVFPISGNLTTMPKPTPTDKPLSLNERTARQLEAWIAYHGMVKEYVSQVNDWSKQVTDSWEKVKASSTSYEQAMKLQIAIRDDEIKKLKGDVLKFTAYGFAGGFLFGLAIGLMH